MHLQKLRYGSLIRRRSLYLSTVRWKLFRRRRLWELPFWRKNLRKYSIQKNRYFDFVELVAKIRSSVLCLEIISVHFFCSSKRNEPKKRAPEMPTSAKTGACYTGLIGATVLSEVRTISGFPLAP